MRVPDYVLFDTVSDFLDNPEEGLAPLAARGIQHFYVGARSFAAVLPGVRNGDTSLAADEIVPLLESQIPPKVRHEYTLRIAEFLQGICAVAKIGRDGIIEIDIARGTLPPLTTGRITPEVVATNLPTRRNPAGRLEYYKNFAKVEQEDGSYRRQRTLLPPGEEGLIITTPVRVAIDRAIRSIPVWYAESEVRNPRLPGRYEFAVVDHGGLQTAIFADAAPFGKLGIE
jgi:hypothetical protein